MSDSRHRHGEQVTATLNANVLKQPVRYMWTMTGMRPLDTTHGVRRFVREDDYDELLRAYEELKRSS